jgi:hypothetical protein
MCPNNKILIAIIVGLLIINFKKPKEKMCACGGRMG